MTWANVRAAVGCGVLAAVGCGVPAQAADKPPAVGDDARDFELTALAGDKVKLSTLTENGPVVVVVLRGYPGYQCPLCTDQFGDFLSHADAFKKAGAKVVMVYPGTATKLNQYAKEFVGDKKLPDHLVLVTDPDYTFVNSYNLRWDAPKETAYPATFVVGADRKVLFSKVSKGHGDRTKADAVLKVIPAK